MRDGWTETTLGDIASWSSGKNLSSDKRHETGQIPILGANGIIGRTNEVLLDEELITVGRVGACGETHRSSGPVWISDNALIVIPTEQVTIDLLFYVLSTFDYQSIISGTTQPLITQSKMKSQVVNLPPLNEQKRIVDMVSSVDAYIDALQRQADTARAARNAVLHELLTAGGDDWTETTLGEVAIWGSGGTPKSGESAYYDGDIPWCVIGDLTEDEVFLTEKCITSEGLKNSSAKIVEPGAVMIAMYGASIGRTGIVGRPMATNQAIAFAYPSVGTLNNRFLLSFLQSQKLQFVEAGQGAAQPNISQTVLKAWPIILPPFDVQKRIVGIVSSMDDVIQATEQAVLDAKNFRSGLLSDLLSGEHEIPASYDSLLGAA